ncbi:MAG: oligosaccharide flippase family protein [Caldilineaceae bacterium]|nr:oligosaccharide flippase family protein [Caldilineaceae bacterium]MCB0145103.1 oligosaccharide flippase family protein [Caldilineaceae bacterium]MCB9155669.1 oligosaccharide flippase family protein [Caldilineaceae bacterium]
MTHYLTVLKRFYYHDLFRRIVGNTGWLTADRLLRMMISLVVGAWVARYLAPDRYGLLSYAGAFVGLFAVIPPLGLQNILIRDLVDTPGQRHVLLGTAFFLQLTTGLAVVVLVNLINIWLNPHEQLTQWLVLILSLNSVWGAFSVIDLWFQSQLKAKYATIAKSGAFFLSPCCALVSLYTRPRLLALRCLPLRNIC